MSRRIRALTAAEAANLLIEHWESDDDPEVVASTQDSDDDDADALYAVEAEDSDDGEDTPGRSACNCSPGHSVSWTKLNFEPSSHGTGRRTIRGARCRPGCR